MFLYTKAGLFNGFHTETDIFVRFSTSLGLRGSADTVRDPRGFGIKFYTPAGNYDILNLNFPIFFINDPIFFPELINSSR